MLHRVQVSDDLVGVEYTCNMDWVTASSLRVEAAGYLPRPVQTHNIQR